MTPTFFFGGGEGRSLSFLILSIILKTKKICTWEVNYSSYTIQIGSNWYMDTGVRDLEDVVFKTNFSWFNGIRSKDLSNRPTYAVSNTQLRYDSSS